MVLNRQLPTGFDGDAEDGGEEDGGDEVGGADPGVVEADGDPSARGGPLANPPRAYQVKRLAATPSAIHRRRRASAVPPPGGVVPPSPECVVPPLPGGVTGGEP